MTTVIKHIPINSALHCPNNNPNHNSNHYSEQSIASNTENNHNNMDNFSGDYSQLIEDRTTPLLLSHSSSSYSSLADAASSSSLHAVPSLKSGKVYSTSGHFSNGKYVEGMAIVKKEQLTNHVQWRTTNLPQNYQLDLYHGTLFGSREIKLNGQRILKDRKILDTGSNYEFAVADNKFLLQIVAQDTQFEYKLIVNGQQLHTEQVEQ
jgi:hypothetical protein